jgi:hypothetical protein
MYITSCTQIFKYIFSKCAIYPNHYLRKYACLFLVIVCNTSELTIKRFRAASGTYMYVHIYGLATPYNSVQYQNI